VSARTVLVVDDEPAIRFGIRKVLERRGFAVNEAASCADARTALVNQRPEAAVLDYRLPDGNALDLLDVVRRAGARTQVIVLTAHATIDLAVEAMKRGAINFFTKPLDLETLVSLIEELPPSATDPDVDEGPEGEGLENPFVGHSELIRALEARARKVCQSESPVLLVGETGTGKGVLARWLHAHSPRRSAPFVDLNCGGLNRDLLESELFGYKAGAFTGAHQSKSGLLEVADGGTILLDEIGDADPRVQTKLLKVLEERKLRRLGEVRERKVAFRLIAATHWDLLERIRSGEFRKDLYYRISILPLMIPPLRERLEDVPDLAWVLLKRLGRGREPELTDCALERLGQHHWPGNVRELRNVLERATLFAEGSTIHADDLHFDPSPEEESSVESTLALTLQESEIRHIQRVLSDVEGSVARAAKRLGVPRSSLYQKLKRYGLDTTSET